jgi:hypothetical protein
VHQVAQLLERFELWALGFHKAHQAAHGQRGPGRHVHQVPQLLLGAQLVEGVPLRQLRRQLPQGIAPQVVGPHLQAKSSVWWWRTAIVGWVLYVAVVLLGCWRAMQLLQHEGGCSPML